MPSRPWPAPHDRPPVNAPVPLHALLAAENLRAILDSTSAGVLVLDSDGQVVDCNPAASALLGLPRDALVGANSTVAGWQLQDRHGQPLRGDQHPSATALRTGHPVRDFLMGALLPSGERRWLLVNANALDRAGSERWAVSSFVDVTAQRQLEEALARQQQRLQAAIDGSRSMIWEWQVPTGEIQLDPRLAESLGYAPADLQPATIDIWTALLHADDLAASRAQLAQHFAGKLDHYDLDCRMRHRNGDWRWVRCRGRLGSRSADGLPLRMYGTHEDVTERKEAERDAARHNELMRALFELSPLGLQLIDMKRRAIVAVNPAMSQVTGYSRDELLSMDGRARFPLAWQPVRDRWFIDAMTDGRFGPSEVEYIHRSGRLINLIFNGVRINDSGDNAFLWLSVQDVTDHRALERELRSAASLDRLTGLANRGALLAALQRRVARAQAKPEIGFALMFLDFDRFKLVNDTLGHDAGDGLLCAIAERLSAVALRAVPEGGDRAWLSARFGGDEFVILLPEVSDSAVACAAADALLATLAEPYQIQQQEIHSTASIGIALWRDGIVSGDDLLRGADTAMYEAKRAGRGRRVVFDDAMRARLVRAFTVESELRHAISRGQLSVCYEPIVNLDTGALAATEALLRWQHPTLGAVAPAEFMLVAEESRHIIALGEWILREACLQWAAWQRQDATAAPATMSVNLSRVQMTLGARLLTAVTSALAAAQMPGSALQLEISEREVTRDPGQSRELMQGLAALGVKLAMDNFGAGTATLSRLRDYAFDTIKIDKSFVTGLAHDPHMLAVAHATINVIENLGMASVAEGIEDPSEVATLQALGCRFGQGHLFSPALADGRLPSKTRAWAGR